MPETGTETTGLEKASWIADRLARLRIAHEAVMTKDAESVLRQSRHVVDQHHRTLGSVQDATPEADDMIVGDITTNISQEAPKPSGSSGMASIAKGLAAAGLAAAGIGSGIALPIAAYNLTKKAVTTIVQDPTEDNDSQYGIRIFKD